MAFRLKSSGFHLRFNSPVPQPKSQTALSGAGFAVITALLFGITTPIAKVFLDQVQPWMLAGLLFLGGGLGLLPLYLIQRWRQRPSASLRSRDWYWLGASILSGGIIGPVLLTMGLAHTPAATASLLLNGEGVFTALLAWTIFRERWHWNVFFGLVAITAGGIVLSQGEQAKAAFSWSALAILGTCLAWAIDSNLTKKVADRDPVQIAMLKGGVAGGINVAIALMLGQPLPPLLPLLGILSVGFLTNGLTLLCFVLALRAIGASRTGAYLALSPFTGAAIAILFLGEPLTRSLVIAAVLMAIGAGLCARVSDG